MYKKFSLDEARFDEILTYLETSAAAMNCPEDKLTQIKIAVSEIVANISTYAFSNTPKHDIEIDIKQQNDRIVIEYVDDGTPFDQLNAASPDTSTPRKYKNGGFGIFIVKRLMDVVAYQRQNNQNVLTIEKIL